MRLLIDAVDVDRRVRHQLLREAAGVGVHRRVNQVVVQDLDVRRGRGSERCRVATLVGVGIGRIGNADAVLLQRRDFVALGRIRDRCVNAAVTPANNRLAVLFYIPRKAEARPQVVLVAAGSEIHKRQRARIFRLRVVFVPDPRLNVVSQTEIEREPRRRLPFI